MQLVTTVTDYASYLKTHSQLHLFSRYVHMNKYVRLNSETDVVTLQAQIDALAKLVRSK